MEGEAGTVTTVRVPVMGSELELPKHYDVVFLEETAVCPECRKPVTKVPGVFHKKVKHLYGRVTRLTFHQFICRSCGELVLPDRVAAALPSTNYRFHADVLRLFFRLRREGRNINQAARELHKKYSVDVTWHAAAGWDKISNSDREKIERYALI